jgi:CBS domain containing-hemolysin-like protein
MLFRARILLFAFSLPLPAMLLNAAAQEELPDPRGLLIPVVVIILLIILNGLFVAAEFAIIGVRPSQIDQLTNEGNKIAQGVAAILDSPEKQNRYIATAQVGITVASLGLGMYGEPQLAHFIEPYLARLLDLAVHDTLVTTVGYVLSLTLLTYLHIVVGEMVPKSLALTTPDKAVLSIAGPMRIMQILFAWPVRLLNGIGNILLQLFRIPSAEGLSRLHSPEELELIVSESVEGGLLDKTEQTIIRNIFDFGERQVNQVMTPRNKVEAIAHDTPLPEILQQMAQSNYSRLPVYQEDLDHIIGILHVKDLVRYQALTKGTFDIRLVLRPVPVVPENYPAEKLLATLKRRRTHFAVVLDEYGGTAGIVTLEDMVEEVVGEVRDEFDREKEPLLELARGVLEVAGDLLLEDISDYADLGDEENLPDVETVGGLIMTQLGRVPQVGDQVSFHNVYFTVLAVDGLAVARARVDYPVDEGTQTS